MKPPSSGTQPASEKPRDEGPVFFFEESLGRKIAAIVASAGFRVTTHMEHFPAGENDTVWVLECARRGWIIVSKDKRIRRRTNELNAVKLSKARMLYFAYGQSSAEEYAASMVKGRKRIFEVIESVPGSIHRPNLTLW